MSNSRRGFLRELGSVVGAAKRAIEPDSPAAAPPPDFTAAELERYSRQLVLPEWGAAGQLAVSEAGVLVIGAGALGSPVALQLAGAGVGRIGILDGAAVELSDLHREALHFTPDVGAPKAESAAAKLRCVNPEIVIEPYRVRIDEPNAAALVEGQHLVVDCSGSFATRCAVNAACCAARVPLVEAGVLGMAGLVMSIRPGSSACYRCVFPVAPHDEPRSADAGVVGPAAGVIGSLQALEALKLLTGLAPAIADGFLQVDLARAEFVRVRSARRPDCPDCSQL